MFHGVSEYGYSSLNQSAVGFHEQQRRTVSKQGIDGKFTKETVEFIKLLFEECFARQVSEIIDVRFLASFLQLRIKDGTRFDIPGELREYFRGFGGGCTSASALCIQYEFDLKTLRFVSFKLTHADVPDIAEARATVGEVSENELILRDLGYFLLESFTKIIERKAFFVSRLNSGVVVWADGKRVCFKKLREHMLQTRQPIVEKGIELGAGKVVAARMVAQLVPEEVYRKRMANLEKTAKKKGYTVSDESRSRCWFFLVITNIEARVMTGENLFKLYRLRWQIELMFKHWKSKMGIHEVQRMKYHRFMCMVLAKLMHAMLCMEIISIVRHEQYARVKKVLSIDKCLKTILGRKLIIELIRIKKTGDTLSRIKEASRLFAANHWQEKRKNSDNFEDILDLFIRNSKT